MIQTQETTEEPTKTILVTPSRHKYLNQIKLNFSLKNTDEVIGLLADAYNGLSKRAREKLNCRLNNK